MILLFAILLFVTQCIYINLKLKPIIYPYLNYYLMFLLGQMFDCMKTRALETAAGLDLG